jgi:uncharacterized integral membrane protein
MHTVCATSNCDHAYLRRFEDEERDKKRVLEEKARRESEDAKKAAGMHRYYCLHRNLTVSVVTVSLLLLLLVLSLATSNTADVLSSQTQYCWCLIKRFQCMPRIDAQTVLSQRNKR